MKDVNLFEEGSIWGRSLVKEGPSKERNCIPPDMEEDKICEVHCPSGGLSVFPQPQIRDEIETKVSRPQTGWGV